jgi:hypothetical protein
VNVGLRTAVKNQFDGQSFGGPKSIEISFAVVHLQDVVPTIYQSVSNHGHCLPIKFSGRVKVNHFDACLSKSRNVFSITVCHDLNGESKLGKSNENFGLGPHSDGTPVITDNQYFWKNIHQFHL